MSDDTQKTIFNVLEANLDENLILKKKSQNLPPNNEIFDIFKILKLVWWPKMADVRLKKTAERYGVSPKIFFLLPTPKIYDFSQQKHTASQTGPFFGGGDEKIWPINQEITCAAKNFRCSLRICDKKNLNTFV